MRNFEYNDVNSYETNSHVICENILDTILDADNIAMSFNNLKRSSENNKIDRYF